MAKNGFLVADSDLHVMEPPDLYERYLEPRYREAAPVWMARPESGHKDFVVKTDAPVSEEWTKKGDGLSEAPRRPEVEGLRGGAEARVYG